jgi:hypothetical protein
MAYFIVVRGVGGSVNESSGGGEGVVKPERSRPFTGEQRHEWLIAQPFHLMVRCYDPNQLKVRSNLNSIMEMC